MDTEEVKEELNLEDSFQGLFQNSTSGTGEEELLRIASTYSRQISAEQIKALLFLESESFDYDKQTNQKIKTFVKRWLELKQYNNSALFVMKALEHISLRKFINDNTMKVNIEK